jgi:hypothetical protein
MSGTNGNTLFYERHLLSHGGQTTDGFVMTYPAALKAKYDPIVSRMSRSFRTGVGSQIPGKP